MINDLLEMSLTALNDDEMLEAEAIGNLLATCGIISGTGRCGAGVA